MSFKARAPKSTQQTRYYVGLKVELKAITIGARQRGNMLSFTTPWLGTVEDGVCRRVRRHSDAITTSLSSLLQARVNGSYSVDDRKNPHNKIVDPGQVLIGKVALIQLLIERKRLEDASHTLAVLLKRATSPVKAPQTHQITRLRLRST